LVQDAVSAAFVFTIPFLIRGVAQDSFDASMQPKRKGAWSPVTGASGKPWPNVKPIDPGAGFDQAWMDQFPLTVNGAQVVNVRGERFRLRGINWYGASDAFHVAGGLDVQSMDTICETVRVLGFTVVRLPFSNEMLRSQVVPGSIDFEKNPSLRGLSALEVLDEVIRCLGQHSVAVILNNHTTYGEWCGGPDRNGLWFHPGSTYTEAQWVQDWTMLALRYSACPHMIGCDLRNEVRFCPWPFRWPSWLGGLVSKLLGGCDWASAAVNCAEEVLSQNPQTLIVVERVIWPMRSLQPYAKRPGPLLPRFQKHLVLGVHHYAWSGPGRYLAFGHQMDCGIMWLVRSVLRCLRIFSNENYGDMSSSRLAAELSSQWAYLLNDGACPVWVSEFGAGPTPRCYDLLWFEKFVEFLASVDVDWAYWPLNVGPKPGDGGDESYGMLAEDWTPKRGGDPRLSLLRSHGLLPQAS